MKSHVLVFAGVLALAACASAPDEEDCGAGCGQTPPVVETPAGEEGRISLFPATFADLPGWDEGRQVNALSAFRASCPRFSALDFGAQLQPAYLGNVNDWRAACDALPPESAQVDGVANAHAAIVRDLRFGEAASYFEENFQPFRVIVDATQTTGLTTAYYEPVVQARRTASAEFREPILPVPDGRVIVETMTAGGARRPEVFITLADGTPGLYPPRGDIVADAENAFAWGRMSDVIFLQIQGSGRLMFDDGVEARAAYAAHNGRPYTSIARVLIDQGHLPQGGASNDAIRAWLDAASLEEARAVTAENERYVFFSLQSVGDANTGPVGAANVALTPNASIAVDPAWHTYGTLYWITPEGAGAPTPRLAVAQDTGSAINGPMRADLYFGTGDLAGQAADVINHRAMWWVLLPRTNDTVAASR